MSLNVSQVSLRTKRLCVTLQRGYLCQQVAASLMFISIDALFQSLLISYTFHLILKQKSHGLLGTGAAWDRVAFDSEQLYCGFPSLQPLREPPWQPTAGNPFLPRPSGDAVLLLLGFLASQLLGTPFFQLLTLESPPSKTLVSAPGAPGEFIHFHISWRTPWKTLE